MAPQALNFRPFQSLLLVAILLVTGCSTSGPARPPTAPGTQPGPTSLPPRQAPPPAVDSQTAPAPTAPETDTATLALIGESERAQQNGSLDEAVAYLERAIRISPRQADLWLRRARLALSQNDPASAIQFAHKSIALAGERLDWQRNAWLVIADAEAARGNQSEAAAIRSRWRTARG